MNEDEIKASGFGRQAPGLNKNLSLLPVACCLLPESTKIYTFALQF
jgi:hypothetical protein